MNPEDIIEALENAAVSPTGHGILEPANASRREILNYRRHLMRFLEGLDAELTIGEVRGVLEEYE